MTFGCELPACCEGFVRVKSWIMLQNGRVQDDIIQQRKQKKKKKKKKLIIMPWNLLLQRRTILPRSLPFHPLS